jgi:hypothetical protein
MIKIIDNKRIDLTEDEYKLYQSICVGYDQGKNLFVDLFETDEQGCIIMLKPPKSFFSMEVVIFLQNIMLHQHLRRIYQDHNAAIDQVKALIAELRPVEQKEKE